MNDSSVGETKPKGFEEELITLVVSRSIGPIIYGIGPGAQNCNFRGENLQTFLDKLMNTFEKVKRIVNEAWQIVCDNESHILAKRSAVWRIYNTGQWAYELATELQPFTDACRYGPSNPLREMYIKRLEEIFTKCFATVHIYGNLFLNCHGLNGLVTDFEFNGGIIQKERTPGHGLKATITGDYLAYFVPNPRSPIVYERFGELIEVIAEKVMRQYPKASKRLAMEIATLVKSPYCGFGRQDINSPAKTALLMKLNKIGEQLFIETESEPALIEVGKW